MRKAVVSGLAVILLFSTAAWAGDVSGKIRNVDPAEKSFTLDDGTKIWVGDTIPVDKLKEGNDVRASYEEKDGKNVATSVEVEE
jgi:Cu/Ag efflux protein CusF